VQIHFASFTFSKTGPLYTLSGNNDHLKKDNYCWLALDWLKACVISMCFNT